MDRKQLLFFKRTAELQHMTKAADELLVSQPFISRTISELEEELGVKLFDHVGRRIEINSCGRAFYAHVVKIFNEVNDAIKEVREINGKQQSQIVTATNVNLYMPKLLRRYKESIPDLKTTLYSRNLESIEKALIDGDIDFAITCPPPAQTEDLESIELMLEPGVIICPRGHKLEGHESVGLEDLRDEPIICSAKGYGTRDIMVALFEKLEITPNIIIETTDTSSVLRYVSDGLGVASVPLSQVLQDKEFKNNYIKIKTPGAVGTIALSWRKSKYLTEIDKSLINVTVEHFRELAALISESKKRLQREIPVP